MARHKPQGTTLAEVADNIASEPVRITTKDTSSLAERLEQAKAKLAAAETVADACYWQGAVDAIEAYSAGWPMPETIGAGVKKS